MNLQFAARSASSRCCSPPWGRSSVQGGCSARGARPNWPVPAPIYAWLIGAIVILFVALTFAELGAMFPESGGSIRYGFYSHGSLVGFVAGWATWIAVVSVIPVEAEASVQYMSSWPWAWAQHLYVHSANGQGELTVPG
jgi:amino acid transporter